MDAAPLAGIVIEAEATIRYSRTVQFGGWRHDPGDCMNTRNRVLADESAPAKLRVRGCVVRSGLWLDPYTGARFTDPRKLDIDHLVPLKEAWESGAWKWPRARRAAYANNLDQPEHLIAVSAAENRRKGDKDPAGYIPPNPAFRCDYLLQWVSVKRRWALTMDAIEAAAIRGGLVTC